MPPPPASPRFASPPPGAGDELPLALVVFAYNEAGNVARVLPPIMTWLRSRRAPYQLLFVDDGSQDATHAEAQQALAGDPHARVLRHHQNRGIGAALKTGVRAATLPWVSFLPCDGQIAPDALDDLCAAASRSRVPVVFSTYLDRNDGRARSLYSAAIRALIRATFGISLRSDGPYLFQRALFDPEALPPDTFFLNFEFPIRVLRARHAHAVVAIHCLGRQLGVSKSTGWRRIAGVARDLVDLRLRLSRPAPPSP